MLLPYGIATPFKLHLYTVEMVFRKCKFRVRIYLRTMKASSEKIIVHLYFYVLFGSLLVQFTKSYDAYKALALGADAVSVAEEF